MKKEVLKYEMPDSWLHFNDKKSLLCELTETFIYFCIIYPLASFVLFFYYRNVFFVLSNFIILFTMLSMTIISVKIKPLFLFLLLNFFIIGLTIYLSSKDLQTIIFALVSVASFIICLKKRVTLSRSILKPSNFVLGACFLGVLYILSLGANLKYIPALIIIFSLILIIVSMVYIHISRANKLSDWEQKYANESPDKIHKFSGIFAAGIVVILLFSFGLAYELRLFSAAKTIDYKIISFFSTKNVKNNYVLPEKNNQKQQNFEMDFIKNDKNRYVKPNPILQSFYKVLELVTFIIVSILIIWLFIKILKAFYFSFYDKYGNENEKREFIFSKDEVLSRTKETIKQVSQKIMEPLDLSNRKKIRKIYYKTVIGYKNKTTKITEYNSANEIASQIKHTSNKDITDITNIYEKARYGKLECSDEDVNKIKHLLNSKK